MSEIALALAQELVSSAPVVSEEGKQVIIRMLYPDQQN